MNWEKIMLKVFIRYRNEMEVRHNNIKAATTYVNCEYTPKGNDKAPQELMLTNADGTTLSIPFSAIELYDIEAEYMNKYTISDTTSDICVVYLNDKMVYSGLEDECNKYVEFHTAFDSVLEAVHRKNPEFSII